METKEYILQRTFSLLLQKGYDTVSISDIRRETAMARGLLYHYFDSKESLLRAAAGKYLSACFDTDLSLTADYGIGEMIRYTTEKYARICNNTWAEFPLPKEVTIANYDFLIYRMSQTEEHFSDDFAAVWQKERTAWESATRTSIARGEIRDEVTPQTVASFVEYLINGIWLEKINRKKPEELIGEMERILEAYYALIKR